MLGGLDFTQNEATDFAHCISIYALSEVNFSGSKYTWWNGNINEACIFERLDRVLVNQELYDVFPEVDVQHFSRQSSDHTPIHVSCNSTAQNVKSFIF